MTEHINTDLAAVGAPSMERSDMERLNVYALVRTVRSSERSLLSLMRTSASLYSFGFTIIKFFDYLERNEAGVQYTEGPKRLGLILISIGVALLAVGVVGHRQRVQIIRNLGLEKITRVAIVVPIALVLMTIGLVTAIGSLVE